MRGCVRARGVCVGVCVYKEGGGGGVVSDCFF